MANQAITEMAWDSILHSSVSWKQEKEITEI
jgi:hypothetical protein